MATLKDEHNEEYSADDIQVLEGMEAVRKRPGMYIGSTDQRGLHHLIYEIVDNSVDEFMGGFCTEVSITIQKDGSVLVQDNGRGIPVDIQSQTGLTALETVMTVLHAGGKFGGKAYAVSGGLHGVGASVVNALSSSLQAEVVRDGNIYTQTYSRGITQTEITSEVAPEGRITGTTVLFMPDTDIFGELVYDFNILMNRFREMAYLNKGLQITFKSDWHTSKWPNHELTFYFDGGISSFVRGLNQKRNVLHEDPIYVEDEIDGTNVEVALQYNETYTESVYAFANCINTEDGGTHVTGSVSYTHLRANETLR